MLEKTIEFDKRLKYVGNDVDMWEMAKICGEMYLAFDKLLKYVGNDFEIWEIPKIFGKWFRYMAYGLGI